jgi:hypothetical protein
MKEKSLNQLVRSTFAKVGNHYTDNRKNGIYRIKFRIYDRFDQGKFDELKEILNPINGIYKMDHKVDFKYNWIWDLTIHTTKRPKEIKVVAPRSTKEIIEQINVYIKDCNRADLESLEAYIEKYFV